MFKKKNIILFSKTKIIKKYFKSFVLFYKKNIKLKLFCKNFLEISGSGGDKQNTFNVSSSVFMLLFLLKIPCVKTGGNSITSASGSSNFFKILLKRYKNFSIYKKKIITYSLGFLYVDAIKLYKNIKNTKIRKYVKKSTIYNYIFCLISIFNVKNKLIGLNKVNKIKIITKSFLYNNIKNCIIVNSTSGLDEASCNCANIILQKKINKILKYILFLKRTQASETILVSNVNDSIKIFKNLIKNKNKYAVKITTLNLALLLYLYNYTQSINEGVVFLKNKFNNKFFFNLIKKRNVNDFKYNIKK
ncbi:hypothetical protein [Candidatus Vidania fulgoroideorum]